MKNILFILFLIIVSSSCVTKDKISVHDNWSMIISDGTYYEIHIDSAFITLYNYDGSFLPQKTYYIINDTFSICHSNNYKDCFDYEIEIINENELVLNNINNSNEINLFRIDKKEFTFDKILNFEDELLRFEVSHLNRKNSLLDIDYRYDYVKRKFDSMDENPPKIDRLLNLQ